ncbi:MAG TPA: nucleotide disphospho-sugar-binding domain-containing protein [Aldersonia sp.]
MTAPRQRTERNPRARFLICTHPITGHVNPALEVARELVARGHEVRVYTGAKFAGKVAAVGARFVPMTRAYDYDDSDYVNAFPGRSELSGIKQITFDFEQIFVRPALDQAADLREILAQWPATVLSDPGFGGAKILFQRGELHRWAVFNISVLGLPSRDVPPFGLGAMPVYSRAGRAKNAVLRFVADNIVFRRVNRALARVFADAGLPPEKFAPIASPMLYLQPSVPAFEYPRSDLIPSAHFIGPVLPRFTGEFHPPAWWDEVVEVAAHDRPVVLVTQGTVATDTTELIEPTLRALAGEDMLVVATTGGRELVGAVPANARVASFVPFDRLMPLADAFVTNCGYGGVMFALSNGLPLVCAGSTEDKPEVGNRVAYCGVGINLETNRPPERKILESVRTVLSHPTYRANARALAGRLAAHDGAAEAASLLEQLAETDGPVLRGSTRLDWAMRARM